MRVFFSPDGERSCSFLARNQLPNRYDLSLRSLWDWKGLLGLVGESRVILGLTDSISMHVSGRVT